MLKSKVPVMKISDSALPVANLISGPDANPGLISFPDEKSALSCQYKDYSFTKPSKVSKKYHGDKPPKNSPVSVIACHNKAWTIKLWKKDDPMDELNIPFTCRTWRHGGDCRMAKGAQDFSRIKTALAKKPGWVYMVLTWPDREGDVQTIYERLGRCFQHFRQWIKRNYAAPGERLEYICLAEQHRDGWPHVNVLIHLPVFQAAAQNNWKKLRRKVRAHAMSTGWGKVFWLEPVKSEEAIAGYFVKLCQEVSKTLQAPMAAPLNFRRLRSSKGLLPPVNKSTDYAGEMVQMETHLAEHHPPKRLLEAMLHSEMDADSRERCARVHYENTEMQMSFLDNQNTAERKKALGFLRPTPEKSAVNLHPLASHPKIKKSA